MSESARYGDPRAMFPVTENDIFSEEQNPSYRSMAQMFAPEPQRPHKSKRDNHATRMLTRLGVVVGLAGVSIALVVGYMAAMNGQIPVSMNRAVSAVQAAVTPSPSPSRVQSTPEPPDLQQAPSIAAKPQPTPPPAQQAEVTSDRGAAPTPPPAEIPLPVEPKSPEPLTEERVEAPAQIAAVTLEPTPVPPPPAPPVRGLSAEEVAQLMSRGLRFIENGDFSSARPVYRRAAEAGYAEAALVLGETYDPVTLAERGAVGMSPDIEQARHWYGRARDLGSPEASTRLTRLPQP